MSNSTWKQFEKAVATFLAALDPTARVKHDVSIPDVDTGTPRQRDVWIEAKLMNHFPVTIYVSCKDVGRALSQQDMDAIIGELRSSGAHMGVAYATGGFSTNALAKAQKVGIACCQLFVDQPPTIPQQLFLPAFLCVPVPSLALEGDAEQVLGVKTFEELFAYNQGSPDGRTLLEYFDEMFRETINEVNKEEMEAGKLPEKSLARQLTLGKYNSDIKLILYAVFEFEFYEGRLEYFLLNGSYCLSNSEFIGSQRLPAISLGDDYPGPAWTPVERSAIEERETFCCTMISAQSYTANLLDTFKGPIPKPSSEDS